MSSQKGNYKKGPQKYQNKTAFKNTLHDTSKKTKEINQIELEGLCERCKEIIEWKIKYKKYKPLTVAKKCTKCEQRTIKQAYFIVCPACISQLTVCGKCGCKKELILKPGPTASEQMSLESQFKQELEMLPERKRRTFIRLQAQGKLTPEEIEQKIKGELKKNYYMDGDSFGDLSDSADNSESDADDIDSSTENDLHDKISKVTFNTVTV